MLPSRAADNLFWVGRYVERTEATLRLVRALINRMTDSRRRRAQVIDAHHARCCRPGARCRATFPTARPILVARAALQGATSKARCRAS